MLQLKQLLQCFIGKGNNLWLQSGGISILLSTFNCSSLRNSSGSCRFCTLSQRLKNVRPSVAATGPVNVLLSDRLQVGVLHHRQVIPVPEIFVGELPLLKMLPKERTQVGVIRLLPEGKVAHVVEVGREEGRRPLQQLLQRSRVVL